MKELISDQTVFNKRLNQEEVEPGFMTTDNLKNFITDFPSPELIIGKSEHASRNVIGFGSLSIVIWLVSFANPSSNFGFR